MIKDMLIGPIILDHRMTGQNYLDFVQTEPLLIIPDLCCSISMTLSLISGTLAVVPLTSHQDLQT